MDQYLLGAKLPSDLADESEDESEISNSKKESDPDKDSVQSAELYSVRSMPFFLQSLQVSVEKRGMNSKGVPQKQEPSDSDRNASESESTKGKKDKKKDKGFNEMACISVSNLDENTTNFIKTPGAMAQQPKSAFSGLTA